MTAKQAQPPAITSWAANIRKPRKDSKPGAIKWRIEVVEVSDRPWRLVAWMTPKMLRDGTNGGHRDMTQRELDRALAGFVIERVPFILTETIYI